MCVHLERARLATHGVFRASPECCKCWQFAAAIQFIEADSHFKRCDGLAHDAYLSDVAITAAIRNVSTTFVGWAKAISQTNSSQSCFWHQ